MARIKDLKTQKDYLVKTGTELLNAYQIQPTLPLKFGCRNGECGVCTIKVKEGHENLSKPTKREKLTLATKAFTSPPYRLACQCAIMGDITLE